MSLRNWKNFHWPYEPLENFTKSEPHQNRAKATHIDGLRRRLRKVDTKLALRALSRGSR